MATRRWLGRAAATFDKYTITVANTWAAADLANITINGKTLVLTVGTTATTAQIATELAKMWNASGTLATAYAASNFNDQTDSWEEYPETAEATAETSSSTVIITMDTPGVPTTITVSETTAGDGTLSISHTTTATGPNYVDNANNWSGGAVPTTGDDVYLDNSAVSLLYGFAAVAAETFASWNQAASFTGEVGLAENNRGGYAEFRTTYLAVGITSLRVGYGSGLGSRRTKLNMAAVQFAAEVLKTNQGAETEIEALLLKGTNASNALEVQGGSVGIAPQAADSSVLATLKVTGGSVQTYGAVTTTASTVSGGNVIFGKAPATLTQTAGNTTILGSGAVTTLTVSGGTCLYLTSGTATTVAIGNGPQPATVDCTGDGSSRTFTTTTIHPNGRLRYIPGTMTFTNAVALGSTVREIMAS